MYCQSCGQEIPSGASFCESCGARLVATGPPPSAAEAPPIASAQLPWVSMMVLALLVVVGLMFGLVALVGRPAPTPVTYGSRARELFEAGRYDEAISEYSQAIALNPGEASHYHDRGYAYSRKGDYQKAIADSNKAIELDPSDAYYYRNRGYAYWLKGEVEKATADFEKCLTVSREPSLTQEARDMLNKFRSGATR